MNASELVRRAYVLAGVINAGQATPGNFAADGLTSLNEMLDAWVADGLDLGIAGLVSSDELTDTSLTYCLRFNLALLFCEENGRDPTPFMRAEAARTKAQLMIWEGDNELEYDSGLTRSNRYDIYTNR